MEKKYKYHRYPLPSENLVPRARASASTENRRENRNWRSVVSYS